MTDSLFDTLPDTAQEEASAAFAAKTGRRPYTQPPAAPGSLTSALAAEKQIPRVKGQCEAVLNYLRLHGPASRQTISHVLELSENSVRPRVRRLLDLGLIEVCGEGITADGNTCELLGMAS